VEPKITYVTTSWDDGHELDMRLAEELAAYGVAGTFYIAPECREVPQSKRISPGALRELADGFEIGGHTLTHPRLPSLSVDDARREIIDGKHAVEEIVGRPVTSFCYPYGEYIADHRDIVRSAGFLVARTVERFRGGVPNDLLEMGTTTHAYRHLVDGVQIIRRARSPRHAVGMWRNWDRLGRQLFTEIQKTGGIFHLWGHSWEIDAHGDWPRLQRILDEISSQDAVFLTNGELGLKLQESA
jgi:peptidoglycan-N-acetylglucosamine deacetylase